MTKEKETYLRNRARVYEIYGIKENDQRYNCHHIIQRSDVGELVGKDFDIDAKSNLYPILKTDHEDINDRIRSDEIAHCCELHPRLKNYYKHHGKHK